MHNIRTLCSNFKTILFVGFFSLASVDYIASSLQKLLQSIRNFCLSNLKFCEYPEMERLCVTRHWTLIPQNHPPRTTVIRLTREIMKFTVR